MRRYYRYYLRTALLVLSLYCYKGVSVASSGIYSEQRPLVIACDWDAPPYEFLDDKGLPAGFTVDVLKAVLQRMGIPYVFEMRESHMEELSFRQHRADIIVGPNDMLQLLNCDVSESVIGQYCLKVLMRTDMPEIHSLKEIDSTRVLVLRRGGDYVQKMYLQSDNECRIQYLPAMEAIVGIATGRCDYFIWGEAFLKWRIRKLHLESLRVCDVSLPVTDIHIGSYDRELLKSIDEQYARLKQSGTIDDIHNKWFSQEPQRETTSPVVLYVTIACGLLLLALFLVNRLTIRSVEKKVRRYSRETNLMNMALDMGGYMVSEYYARNDEFKNLRGRLMDESKNLSQSVATIHPDDLPKFQADVDDLIQHRESHTDMQLRRNLGTVDQPDWQYITGCCIREYDEEELRTSYLLVAKDITGEVKEQQADQEMAAKYNKAFEIALLAMSFYSPEGKLLEMNDKMKEVIGVNDENQQFFRETSLFEAPLFQDILVPGMPHVVHACQHMFYPDINLNKYLEYRIRPVFTEEGKIRYYVVTVRDVSAERSLYLEQQATERQLKVTNSEVLKFEAQLNELLSNSGMFIWRSNNRKRTMNVSRSLHKTERRFSYDTYLDGLAQEDYNEAFRNLNNPLLQNRDINVVRHFRLSPLTNREGWFAVSGMPYFDRNGHVKGYFGIVRDVTNLMRSQQELRHETAQAQYSGQQKATFLANMTHEIRTPLNAIVGFSDLLHTVDTPEERQEFISIIRHNCDLLLRLIDDLLETSSMDSQLQHIEPEDTDFAQFFDEVCQTLLQRVEEPSVEFISDNPYDTLPACFDKQRIQQVITNFVTNAVKYTHNGHIKLGYRLEDEGIYVYCEDTGAGIPRDKQASVFDRFVKLNDYIQGTGLGLSICKAIADRCQGRIGVDSEGEGKGSTFWLWIPRYLTLGNLTGEK